METTFISTVEIDRVRDSVMDRLSALRMAANGGNAPLKLVIRDYLRVDDVTALTGPELEIVAAMHAEFLELLGALEALPAGGCDLPADRVDAIRSLPDETLRQLNNLIAVRHSRLRQNLAFHDKSMLDGPDPLSRLEIRNGRVGYRDRD